METVHRANAARLRAIIDEYGWPGRALVGERGADAAWRIAQHAIGEPAFMRQCRDLLAAAPDVPRWHFAYIDDRARTFEGRPQCVTGTQLRGGPGGLEPCPLEDASRVGRGGARWGCRHWPTSWPRRGRTRRRSRATRRRERPPSWRGGGPWVGSSDAYLEPPSLRLKRLDLQVVEVGRAQARQGRRHLHLAARRHAAEQREFLPAVRRRRQAARRAARRRPSRTPAPRRPTPSPAWPASPGR